MQGIGDGLTNNCPVKVRIAEGSDAPPANEMQDEYDHRDHENDVDDAACDLHDETEQPESEQDKSDSEEHTETSCVAAFVRVFAARSPRRERRNSVRLKVSHQENVECVTRRVLSILI